MPGTSQRHEELAKEETPLAAIPNQLDVNFLVLDPVSLEVKIKRKEAKLLIFKKNGIIFMRFQTSERDFIIFPI